MFRHKPSAKRTLWADESTPCDTSATIHPQLPVSFNRATSLVNMDELIHELKGRPSSPELTVMQTACDFVNIVMNNSANIVDKVTALIIALKKYDECHSDDNNGAFAYCTTFLAKNLGAYSITNLSFRGLYEHSSLKTYLESVVPPQNLSPQKLITPQRKY
tara:strand:- start:1221 stop:1703 length:483 start_codon:yes stop_codon:yes gene_type:complete